jgi:hypothetical protein
VEILKHEVSLELNDFQEQKYLDINHSVAQVILNILLMRPGNMPGLPHIGVNIKEYLYKLEDTIDPEELKAKIMAQCVELMPGLITNNIDIFFTNDQNGRPMLIISVGLNDLSQNNLINFGFIKNNDGSINYLYEFEAALK